MRNSGVEKKVRLPDRGSHIRVVPAREAKQKSTGRWKPVKLRLVHEKAERDSGYGN